MTILTLYGTATLVVLIAVTVLWAISVPLRDASIIDMFWGPLFVAMAWVLLAFAGEVHVRTYLITLLVTLWGLRLAYHLITRNLGQGEDARYRRWRERGGPTWWLASFYRVYLLQGAIALMVATPIVAAFYRPDGFNLINFTGLLVWALGFVFELVADVQLAQFKARPDNRGRILDEGLWGLSRHPNYFGDAVQWWGLGLVAATPGTWWALVGPAVMTGVFITLSNDVLERGMKRRHPEYDDYVTRTPKFLPRLRARRT